MISLIECDLEVALIPGRIAATILEFCPLDTFTCCGRSTLDSRELEAMIAIGHEGAHHIPEISDEATP